MNIKQGLVFFFLAAAVTACGGSSSGGGGGAGTTTSTNPTANFSIPARSFRVSAAAATLGDLEVIDPTNNSVVRTLDLNLNGSILITSDDTLISTQSTGAGMNVGKLVFIANVSTRTGAFSTETDGELFVSGLSSAAATVIDEQSGAIFIANNRNAQSMDGNIIVVSRTATGSSSASPATPLLTSATIGGQPIGIVYDKANDDLYVATTFARLLVFRNVRSLAGMTNVSPTQTINLRDAAAAALSFPRGAVFDLPRNVFYVADAGIPNQLNDSAVFRFDFSAVSSATTDLNGTSITVGATIDEDYGPLSLNQTADHLTVVDTFEQRSFVLEQPSSNATPNTVLVRTDVSSASGDNEESSASQSSTIGQDVILGIDDPIGGSTLDSADSGLTATRGTPTTVVDLDNNMTTTLVDADRSRRGNVTYTAFKRGATGGIQISSSGGKAIASSQSARLTSQSQSSTNQERQISGSATTIDCPVAVSFGDFKEALFVLDDNGQGTFNLLSFNPSSQGDVAPEFSVSIPMNITPIDIAYSRSDDRLYLIGREGSGAPMLYFFDDICMTKSNAVLSQPVAVTDFNGNAVTNMTSLDAGLGFLYITNQGQMTGSTDDGQVLVLDIDNIGNSVRADTTISGNLQDPSHISQVMRDGVIVTDGDRVISIPNTQLFMRGNVTATVSRPELTIPNVKFGLP